MTVKVANVVLHSSVVVEAMQRISRFKCYVETPERMSAWSAPIAQVSLEMDLFRSTNRKRVQ